MQNHPDWGLNYSDNFGVNICFTIRTVFLGVYSAIESCVSMLRLLTVISGQCVVSTVIYFQVQM